MAQSYNVYLNRKLTEFDLIIHNLPYRDGIIVYNKMYLDAMVSYLELQKFIIAEYETDLRFRIDELLEEVYNIFKSGAELSFHAEASSAKPIAGSSEMYLDTATIPVNEEVFNTFSQVTQLLTSRLNYELSKPLGSGSNKILLNTKALQPLKEAFEKFEDMLYIDTSADPSSVKFTSPEVKMALETRPFDIFYMLTAECEAVINLLCKVADIELWYTLGTAKSGMVLTAHNSDIHSEKFMTIEDLLCLISVADFLLTYFVDASDIGFVLTGSVLAGLRRYRKISEVDPYTIPDLDDLPIEDLDYVVLA